MKQKRCLTIALILLGVVVLIISVSFLIDHSDEIERWWHKTQTKAEKEMFLRRMGL